ncbi:hypothetical protein [Apilactobacillus timberlakei]|uniref:hypothetical protein n=1 Tax=Apilactobacillus timberlakei TaxID=2008380 RepID=UPI001127DAF2|nr:hypothetical protein [Apilactobacillus timberlakei]
MNINIIENNKHPSILWDVNYKEHKKEFITKVATKLCNHYDVSKLVIPASLLDDKFSRQDLLKEILNLVLAETSLCKLKG